MHHPQIALFSQILSSYECRQDGTIQVNSGLLDDLVELIIKMPLEHENLGSRGFRRYPVRKYGCQEERQIIVVRYELEMDHTYGVIFHAESESTFRDYFAYLLLHTTSCSMMTLGTFSTPASEEAAAAVTNTFECMLLYDVYEKKEWNRSGRNIFRKKVQCYTDRRMTIEMALPAFPCKSTNPEKVASQVPDGAEYEALLTLVKFCDEVTDFYAPGCRIVIVSDGHVFSDCIGADDNVVTHYSRNLKSMLDNVRFHHSRHASQQIQLCNLADLLFPDREAERLYKRVEAVQNLPIKHPVSTQTDEFYNTCRGILMHGFAPPEPFVKDLISKVPDHSITTLYRGFSRFMLDDLALHSDIEGRSRPQRKKAAETVALEMILRNQAYSRLVEMVLPNHIRLSIHAHNNAGPKFAVKLLPFKPITNASELAISKEDALLEALEHLHIPTPWHTALMVIHHDGRQETIACKTSVAEAAIRSKKVFGMYQKNHVCGGRFVVVVPKTGRGWGTKCS
ncbi:dityrosine synthesis enzyme [Neophaeococcomyces mojaviensis]|uniref:Dityrosine synthesis enzyme n=1 Tax=Neophaeococcomyces mojaviensis TaxID=3383035 RepID=A0ACC3AG60_9EURO|nr:dityrosine synthesis enzyme [Knufia sp. JES_112]